MSSFSPFYTGRVVARILTYTLPFACSSPNALTMLSNRSLK